MDAIQKTYGSAICLLYGIYIALNIRHMKSQMPAVSYAYGIYG